MSNSIDVKVVMRRSEIFARVTMSDSLSIVTIHASEDGVTWSDSCLTLSMDDDNYPELRDLRDETGEWIPEELAALLCPADLEVIPDEPAQDGDTEELNTWEFVP